MIDEPSYDVAVPYFLASAPTGPEDACWLWTGRATPLGYGKVYAGRRCTVYAHRVAFYIHHGRLPEGELDHTCRTPACVNPCHLEDVTHKENIDRSPHRHKDFCIRGHAMVGDNLYIKWEKRPPNYLIEKHICKACRRERAHQRGGWRR
jgi:hypothetical protein